MKNKISLLFAAILLLPLTCIFSMSFAHAAPETTVKSVAPSNQEDHCTDVYEEIQTEVIFQKSFSFPEDPDHNFHPPLPSHFLHIRSGDYDFGTQSISSSFEHQYLEQSFHIPIKSTRLLL